MSNGISSGSETAAHLAQGLYVVATPIGNLGDISERACSVLADVDVIAAEDTRHTQALLAHLGIHTRCVAFHEHNESQMTPKLIERIRSGESIALVSDAGTPLVSDPGYRLVAAAHEAELDVVPIPGACAAIAALSVSGIATDHFVFEGFPPAKSGSRINYFKTLSDEPRTILFYVSCHRLLDTVTDMCEVFGDEREATLAREITKTYETIKHVSLGELRDLIASDANQQRGEIVIVLSGSSASAEHKETDTILRALLEELPVKKAAALTAKITGESRNVLYDRAISWKDDAES